MKRSTIEYANGSQHGELWCTWVVTGLMSDEFASLPLGSWDSWDLSLSAVGHGCRGRALVQRLGIEAQMRASSVSCHSDAIG